jgi:Tol biopolymer transport system component
LSPDSERVAFTWTGPRQDNQDVYVQQVGAGTPLRLTTDAASDYSPAWAPDGRALAFLRRVPNATRHELRLVPPLGGAERKLADIQPYNPVYRPLTIAWCPDGTCVIAPDGQGEGKGEALYAFSLDGGARRQLTFPPAGVFIDADPAISPDGQWMVFRRDLTPFTGEMYRVALGTGVRPSGDPTKLTDIKMSGTRPAWMPNNREIVFAARGGLWRMDALSPTAPSRLPFVGQDGVSPTISRTLSPAGSLRLSYTRIFSDTNLWRVDTAAAGVPAETPPQRMIASTRSDHLPSLSPDGKRIAFFSGRSGE